MQDDHRPLLGPQALEAALQLLPIGDGTGIVTDRRLDLEQSDLVRQAPELPALVRAGVDHQAIEPGIELVRIAQGGKLLPRANKRFLHCVLRQVRSPKDQPSDRVQAITGGGREDFKCLVVSAPPRLNELAPHSLSISGTSLF